VQPVIRNLIWDVDGTLFDTYPAIIRSLQGAAADLGVDVGYEEVRDHAMISVDHCLALLSERHGFPVDGLADGFARRYLEVSPADQPPFDGVGDVCRMVRARGGLNLIVTHRRRVGLDRLLVGHGMADLFIDIISHDDGYPRKPDPSAFRVMIERHRLSRDDTLAVGDRDIDIAAAHAAGLPGAFFGTGSIRPTPDFVLLDFGVLRQLIEASPAR
jgi:phosphoglycolate phosphatase-like HAD superfamily hydrolase